MMFNIVHTKSEQFSWCWQKKNRIREVEQEENNELRNRRKRSDQGDLLRGIDSKTVRRDMILNCLHMVSVTHSL